MASIAALGTPKTLILGRNDEDRVVFEDRFTRCRGLLSFLAIRILNDQNMAEIAVQNCKVAASRNPPNFEYESAFRSWLVRILIEESLTLLRHRG